MLCYLLLLHLPTILAIFAPLEGVSKLIADSRPKPKPGLSVAEDP